VPIEVKSGRLKVILRVCLVKAVWLAAAALVPIAAHGQVLDRIVATVGQQVITLSDVRAAKGLGLLHQPANATQDSVVDRLVERELMRVEIERFGVPAPPVDVLETRIDAVRERFASPAAFTAALEAYGLSEARFRAWVADDWRIEQYIQQRFDAAAQPTDEDVLQYYQSREREFEVNDRPRPFAEVREEARRRLLASRRQALVDDWVTGLKRRAEITILSPHADRGPR
jgi:hypothetical protein